MNFKLTHTDWIFESNGKLHFKQQQLFQLHRLMLVVLSETGLKLRYRTPAELKVFLQMAASLNRVSVQTQLKAVLSTLPEKWQLLKEAC